MSLPLRLPYCSPARRLRAVLLFPCFRAPVTPPPSPACSQEPEAEPDGGAPEGGAEEEAWLSAAGPGRRSAGAVPHGWAGSGPPGAPHGAQARPRPRPGPPPSAAPAPPASASPLAVSWRSQSIRPSLLGRRPAVAQGLRRARDRPAGASGPAAAGGKEPELRVQNDRRWRTVEEAPVPRPLAVRGVAGRGAYPGKRSGKPSKPASASPEKLQGTCKKVTLEFRGVDKAR